MSHMLKPKIMRRNGVDIFFFDRKIMKMMVPEPISDRAPSHINERVRNLHINVYLFIFVDRFFITYR